MPITDNNFTVDELDAVVTANPKVLEELTAYATKKGGYFAPDAAKKSEYETNLDNLTKSRLTSEHATNIEKDVEEVTGVKKLPNEKYYEYNKRVLSEKTAREKSLDAELTGLKSKTDLSAAERERIATLEGLTKSKDTEIQTLKDTHQSEINQLKAENIIYSKIGAVDSKLKKTPELQEAIQIVKERVIEDMKKSAKFQDGKMVFFGADGKALLNADASFMSADQVYAARMDSYIDKGKTAGGTGGNGEWNQDIIVTGDLKTKNDVDSFLSSKGLLAGTAAYSAEQKKYGYDKLPLQ